MISSCQQPLQRAGGLHTSRCPHTQTIHTEPAKSFQSSSSMDAPVSDVYSNLAGQLPPSTQLWASPSSSSSPTAAAGARLQLHPTHSSRGGMQPLMICGCLCRAQACCHVGPCPRSWHGACRGSISKRLLCCYLWE